jgi:hypothetical protein
MAVFHLMIKETMNLIESVDDLHGWHQEPNLIKIGKIVKRLIIQE